MQILTYFKPITEAMLQILILGALGFFLVRSRVISKEGLNGLTRLLIEVVFPALIFWQIIEKFNFYLYPNWWIFPLLSMAIIGFGALVGYFFSFPVKDQQARKEFTSLVAFQNAGYLPLTLLGGIVPKEQLSTALIYLFLFLLGFNVLIWSWGVSFLTCRTSKCFSFSSLFSAPVIATLLGFAFVITGLNKVMPTFVLKPLEMLGECSFPLAIIVVGASLADLYGHKPLNKGPLGSLIVVKLIILPLCGLLLVGLLKLPYLIGLLIVLELSMPSATTLAVIVRRYNDEETFISQGIFLTHILSLITVPIFLALLNWIVF